MRIFLKKLLALFSIPKKAVVNFFLGKWITVKKFFYSLIDRWNIVNAALRQYSLSHKENSTFLPLTPIDLSGEKIEKYEIELLHGLENKNIKNIAVTGDYGSGKSSFLKSFMLRNSYYNYANISLASFNKCKTPIYEIEENIVQQLLYSTSHENLPKSRLKRINHINSLKVIAAIIFIFLFSLSIFTFYEPTWPTEVNLIPEIVDKAKLPKEISGLIILSSIFYILYKLIRILFSFNIDRITVKAGPIETENNKSALHKNIDEILYFFEQTNIDMLVIEDLDRFDNPEILSRLREINIILNSSPSINRTVKFVYAVKDSLFTATDRTKFFDLIIPIVPIINSENSKEKFIEILNGINIRGKSLYLHIDNDLIEHISYYVDDMRLLINICNEINLYSSILCKNIDISIKKLFSMIAIKNIYPEQHSKLIKKDGLFYELFKKRDIIKSTKINELNEKIKNIEKEIEISEKEAAKSIDELRIILWHYLGSKAGIYNYTHITTDQNSYIGIKEFIADENFHRIFEHQSNLEFYRRHQSGRQEQAGTIHNPSNILKSKDFNYINREVVIKKNIHIKKSEINDSKKEISLTKNYNIKDIIENIIDDNFRKEYGLVVFLIRRGFFSEDYSDYLSYFYPGSLDLIEKNIILKIKEGHLLPETTKIKNVPIILSHIPPHYLNNGYGLIADIIQYLLNNESFENKHGDNTQYLINILEFNKNIDQIFRIYISFDNQHKKKLLEKIAKIRLSIISDLYIHQHLDEASNDIEFIVNILDSLSERDLESIRKANNILSDEIINSLPTVSLLYDNRNSANIGWKWFWRIPHEFSSISEEFISKNHLDLIVKDNNYEINAHMMRLIISKLLNFTETKNIVAYKNILEINNTYLLDNVNAKLSPFVDEILLSQETLDESEQSLIALLNKKDIDDYLRSNLIEKSNTQISSIKSISDEGLWIPLIQFKTIKCSWENVIEFYNYYHKNDSTMQPELEAYLSDSSVVKILENEKLPNNKFFIDALICNKNIPIKAIIKYIGSSNFELENIQKNNIRTEIMESLIRNGNLAYSTDITNFINENYIELTSIYLLTNWDFVEIDIFKDIQHEEDLILDIIKSEKPKTDQKLLIIASLESSVIENDSVLSTAISELIIKAHTEEDLTIPTLDDQFLISLISNNDLVIDNRVKILALTLNHHKWITLNKILPYLKGSGFEKLGSKKLSVSNNDNNLKLINKLYENGFLTRPELNGSTIEANFRPSSKTG